MRPTPEVVSLGFQRAVLNGASIGVIAPCLLLDIGGATTDLHYTVEIVKDGNGGQHFRSAGASVARYVFTDLGIVASRDSLLLQLRSHSRLYEFLGAVLPDDVTETYRLFAKASISLQPELLALRLLVSRAGSLCSGPRTGASHRRLGSDCASYSYRGWRASLVGGDSQESRRLGYSEEQQASILIDRKYQIWVEGISFAEQSRRCSDRSSQELGFIMESYIDERWHGTSLAELHALADRYGTPYFLYDVDEITRRIDLVRESLAGLVEVYYAVKANPNLELLRRYATLRMVSMFPPEAN